MEMFDGLTSEQLRDLIEKLEFAQLILGGYLILVAATVIGGILYGAYRLGYRRGEAFKE